MHSPAPPRSSFVSVMAWLTLALAALGVAGNALQALLVLAFPQAADLGALLPPGTPLPPALDWLGRHALALSLWSAAGSLLLGWISWQLLQRREWARLAFIALLLLAALANFACIPLANGAMTLALPGANGASTEELTQLRESMAPMLAALRAMLWIGALAIAVLHGWIAWRLCRPEIRAEFS